MNKHFFSPVFIFLILATASCSSSKKMSNAKPAWEENFNQQVLDTTRWIKIPRGTSDWDRHMSYFDSCYAMRDGKLILRGLKNSNLANDTARYITGGVYTHNKVSFGEGRLVIRAKLNGAKGAWPAFWMLPENATWPDGGEIDIMERLNFDSIVYQTVHSYYTLSLKIKNDPLSHIIAPINPDGFNTYAVEKYADSLVFFVNDIRTFSYPRIKTDKQGQFPFNLKKQYLLIDMQLGGSWVGEIKDDDLPVEMEIDWVRFYSFKK
ncbi:MAG: glycoside hydrolase family 16 protein [Ginsengibacter sp.]